MNNTIDFNTAKTIGTMSKKIDHIDDTVSGFFSFMHMVIRLHSAENVPIGWSASTVPGFFPACMVGLWQSAE